MGNIIFFMKMDLLVGLATPPCIAHRFILVRKSKGQGFHLIDVLLTGLVPPWVQNKYG